MFNETKRMFCPGCTIRPLTGEIVSTLLIFSWLSGIVCASMLFFNQEKHLDGYTWTISKISVLESIQEVVSIPNIWLMRGVKLHPGQNILSLNEII